MSAPFALEIGDLRVHREITAQRLLGPAHLIESANGQIIAAMSAIDWERPTQIPTIDAPGKLPPGAGARIMNAIAERAAAAGVTALRYAGPYPTAALYRAALRSFRTRATEAEFTAELLPRLARLARDELPFEFAPAPHARVDFAHGWSEMRDGVVERAVIDGTAFEPDGSPGRLVDHLSELKAELWFGDAVYAEIAELDARGALVTGPHAPPQLASRVIGAAFPDALCGALAELVADAVPPPLADDARARVATGPIIWADLGARTARATAAGFEVHAVLWERIAPLGLGRLALAIAEALAPIVARELLNNVASRLNPSRSAPGTSR